MKKLLCAILMLVLCLFGACALAEEYEIPEISWTYPVPLSDLQSEYAMLVNGNNVLDKSFAPDPQVKVTGVKRATSAAVYMEETAAEALKEMFAAAAMVTEYNYVTADGKEKTAKYDSDAGMVLYLKSGYRKYGTQATIYANYLERNNGVDDGYVAKPGTSEHQTGLCADILNDDYAGRPTMTQDFKWTPEAQWMKANCADFGFILRFLEGREDETGTPFEPWHFRYVGKNIAGYVMSNEGMTLEAFTVEAQSAINDFLFRGGNIQEQMDYEYKKANMPPVTRVLDEYGEDGDAEVSLLF